MIALARGLLVLLLIVLSFPFLCLYMLINPSKNRNLYVACRVYALINRICAVRVDVHGFDRVPTTQPYIYVANHQCNHDVLIVAQALNPGTVIVAKQSLKWLPLPAVDFLVGLNQRLAADIGYQIGRASCRERV